MRPKLQLYDNKTHFDVAAPVGSGKLTATEYNLLTYLVQNAGLVLTHDQILENVWGSEYKGSADYVHVYVSHLRQKLEPDPKNPVYLVTEFGVGYRFVKQSSAMAHS